MKFSQFVSYNKIKNFIKNPAQNIAWFCVYKELRRAFIGKMNSCKKLIILDL